MYMNTQRKKELQHLVKVGVPVPLIESRNLEAFQSGMYDDHYTIQELIEQGLLRYVGRRNNDLFVRPLSAFSVYATDHARELSPGEIIMLQLGEDGRKEFAAWSGD